MTKGTDPASPTLSVQDATYEWIRRHIASVPHHTGDFLSEAKIASALGTSRTPVREAFLRLETEGLLQILPKKGAYVPAISESEAQALMEARILIEDWCIRRTAVNGLAVVDELETLVAEQERLAEEHSRFIDCDRQFHQVLVLAASNPVLASFYDSLRERQIRLGLQAVKGPSNRVAEVLKEHRSIIEALREEDPARAAAAVVSHLEATWARLRGSGVYPMLRAPVFGVRT